MTFKNKILPYINSLEIGNSVTFWKKYKTCRSRHIYLKSSITGTLIRKNQETLTLDVDGRILRVEKYRIVVKEDETIQD
jgi:hypothetical protein